MMECGKCGGSNNPYSRFCNVCGGLISPPSNMNPNVSMASTLGSTSQPTWLAQIDAKAAQILNKQYSTIGTQTYGLFYTSAKGLENKSEKEGKILSKERDLYDKKPTLTTVSAGKGELFLSYYHFK